METTMLSESEEREILKERAKKLAAAATVPETGAAIQVLSFKLGAETYAMEERFISEVILCGKITPLPCVPSFIQGIISIRGRIVAVLDLLTLFGLPGTPAEKNANIIILQSPENEFGFLSAAILGLSAIPLDLIQDTLPSLSDGMVEYFQGISSAGLVILDARKLLCDKKINVNESVGRMK